MHEQRLDARGFAAVDDGIQQCECLVYRPRLHVGGLGRFDLALAESGDLVGGKRGTVTPVTHDLQVLLVAGCLVDVVLEDLAFHRLAQARFDRRDVLAPRIAGRALRGLKAVRPGAHGGKPAVRWLWCIVELGVRRAVEARQQGLHPIEQRVGRRRQFRCGAQRLGIGRVEPAAPVIAHDILQQGLRVIDALLLEQAHAVEGMLTQHAAAPAVDRVDRRLVHPLCRGLQLVRVIKPAVARPRVAQFTQRAIVRLVSRGGQFAEHGHGLANAQADAVAQLLSRRFREGHHQNLRRHELLATGTRTQQQPQVEHGQRPRLTRAGAGLDDLQAIKGEAEDVQRGRGTAHSASAWKARASVP